MSNSEAWLPPDDPDPSQVLDDVLGDIRKSQYDVALCKLLWFHEHALDYNPHLGSVRTSFALSYWFKLGGLYSPARDAFFAARDRAEQAFKDSHFQWEYFMELSAFNRQVDETSRTVELFKHVAETESEAAHLLYNLAEPYLIQNECYSVCAPFLETSQRLAMAADIYRFESELEDAERDSFSPIPKLARFQYVSEASTLVALLVRNDRLADAKAACDIALETIDDARFRKTLDKAMKGKFPASRPE